MKLCFYCSSCVVVSGPDHNTDNNVIIEIDEADLSAQSGKSWFLFANFVTACAIWRIETTVGVVTKRGSLLVTTNLQSH